MNDKSNFRRRQTNLKNAQMFSFLSYYFCFVFFFRKISEKVAIDRFSVFWPIDIFLLKKCLKGDKAMKILKILTSFAIKVEKIKSYCDISLSSSFSLFI